MNHPELWIIIPSLAGILVALTCLGIDAAGKLLAKAKKRRLARTEPIDWGI